MQVDNSPEMKLKRERRARKVLQMLCDMLRMMGYRKLTPLYIEDMRTGEKFCE